MANANQVEDPAPQSFGGEPDSEQGSEISGMGAPEVQKRSSGPRTELGKERCKYNALKHGLFSRVVLLSHEPRSEFVTLLKGLQDSFKPQGTLEQMLVEKLATVLWRYRRLLQAESAEILKNLEDDGLEKARVADLQSEAEWSRYSYLAKHSKIGLIAMIKNRRELSVCLQHLEGIRKEAEERGLGTEDEDFDQPFLLALLYGTRYSGRPGNDLYDCFDECLSAFKATPTDREKRGFSSQEACVRKFVGEVDKEMQRLNSLQVPAPSKGELAKESAQKDIGILKAAVPDSAGLDRLLRYEVSVERAFDRTLAQLAKLQRIRLEWGTIDVARPMIADGDSVNDRSSGSSPIAL